MKNKAIFLFGLIILLLTGCSQNIKNIPQAPTNVNTKWVCEELDAFFVVNEAQQCYGEIHHNNDCYYLIFHFSEHGGFSAFQIEDMDSFSDVYRPTDYAITGSVKYYNDRCVLVIKNENNRLWEMSTGIISLTFYKSRDYGDKGTELLP